MCVAVPFGMDWNPKISLYFAQFKTEFKWAEMYFKDSLITPKNPKTLKMDSENLEC